MKNIFVFLSKNFYNSFIDLKISKEMKKFYSKSKLLVFSLFIIVLLCISCDKPAKLDGTTWRSDYFEGEITDNNGDEVIVILREGVSISFVSSEHADVRFGKMLCYYKEWNLRFESENMAETANYIYKKKNLTIRLNFAEQNWTGMVDKKKMILSNVFGKTVEFKKLNKYEN